MPDRLFAGSTVLAVFAHPDDESLACGGTLARLADSGARVVLICASRGDRGPAGDPAPARPELGRARAQELRAAAAVLGVADLLILGHPDGNLRWAEVAPFHAELMIALRRFRPDAVLTFGDDGLYWHADHIGVHERTVTAIRSLGAGAPPLYCVTMPRGAMKAVVEAAHARGASPLASAFWGINPDAFGVSAEPPAFTVDVRPWIARKLAALRCHRTQFGPHNPLAWIDEDDARRWLGDEQFRRMEPAATSLLDGIGRPAHVD
ncbi:MAG: PIG-L family deacetylase [Acidobacteria bacterium]|nr:PIG-L family deacetylase [Acidobacteriota bacterium]